MSRRPASIAPAESSEAVKIMTERFEKSKISFWKLKDQMVAADIPGAIHADWAEDLIALAVQHNFTPDFTIRRGLPPPPKAICQTHSGGAAAGTPVFQGAIKLQLSNVLLWSHGVQELPVRRLRMHAAAVQCTAGIMSACDCLMQGTKNITQLSAL